MNPGQKSVHPILKNLELEANPDDDWEYPPSYITKINDNVVRIKFYCAWPGETFGWSEKKHKEIHMEVEKVQNSDKMLTDKHKAIRLGRISINDEGLLNIVSPYDYSSSFSDYLNKANYGSYFGLADYDESCKILDSLSEKIVGINGSWYHGNYCHSWGKEPQLQKRFDILYEMLKMGKLKHIMD